MKTSTTLLATALFAAALSSASAARGPVLQFSAVGPETDYSKAPVYVATNATISEIEAARLVVRAIRVIAGEADPTTNAAPAIVAELPASGPAIVVGWQGTDLVKPYAEIFGLKGWKENAGRDVIVEADSARVLFLVGNSPEGAYYAAADFLYRNGARFLHTGTEADHWSGGIFLEPVKALKVPAGGHVRRYSPLVRQRTGFALGRKLPSKRQATDEEMVARNQFAACNGASPMGPLDGGHSRSYFGSECIQPAYHDFKKTPDFFPMVDGKRWRPAPGGWCWVVEGCWSNPDFTQWVVDRVSGLVETAGPDNAFGLDITNSDGGRRCDCPDCQKLRASYPDISSCYFDYQRKIIQAIKKRHPGLHVESLAYIMSRDYPKAGNAVLSEQDAIDYCPYSRCYVHRYDDPACPTNKRDLERMAEWKKAHIPVGDFDYSYDVFNPPMSLPTWELAAEIVTYWKAFNGTNGIPRMYAESATYEGGNGGKSRLSAYVFARTMWDDSRSADEHLQDFCRVGYGSGAEAMLAYHRASAVAWTNQPAHLTGTFNNPLGTAKSYFTPALQALGEKAFASAQAAIEGDLAAGKGKPARESLARKQLATLLFEKAQFDEWKALREKAVKTSLQVNLELGAADARAFDSMEKIPLKPREGGEDVTKSFAQFYRTADAIRVRVTAHGPVFKAKPWKEDRADNGKSYGPDSMEFFIQAPGRSDYYQFAVSSEGFHYDGRCLDGAFDSDAWKTASREEDGLWELTLTIPFAMFDGYKPGGGDVFKFIAISNSQVLDERGEPKGFAVGLPYPAYHDMAIGIDLRLDDNAGRRAGQ